MLMRYRMFLCLFEPFDETTEIIFDSEKQNIITRACGAYGAIVMTRKRSADKGVV